MRKYIIIFPIFFVSIFVVFFYLFRWNEISKENSEYENIKSYSYQLSILNNKHKLLFNSLMVENNYDEISRFTLKFNLISKKLIQLLNDSRNIKLVNLAKIIKEKNINHKYIYEDIKTDTSEIKNSIKWVSRSYKRYLENIKEIDPADTKLIRYITDVLLASSSEIFLDIKPYKFSTGRYKADRLEKHLSILHEEHKTLILLKQSLIENDIAKDLENINKHVLEVLSQLKEETSSIVKSFLISTIFLILFGLIVYVREVLISLKVDKLKNELQQFVDALNHSAIVSKADLSGRITYANDMFCEISGYKIDELIGEPHNIIRHPDTPASVFKELWETVESKNIFKATIQNRKKNGEAYYVDSVVIPMVDINNNIVEYMAVRYDVTELIESRDKAIMAEKSKDEFLSNMSHELRTPLNAIKGFSNILNREIVDEKHSIYLHNIIDSSEHLIGLIGDILDLSKLESGKFSLDYHDFNMEKKLGELLTRFDAQLEILNLEMNIELDSSLNTTLNGDWLRISQIINNLISNAMKFTPNGGKIDFIASYKNDNFSLIVRDSGIGMSKKVQEKIFSPFEQADTSTTREFGGTGLGLSIVLSLVEQMHGDVKLLSKENEGSEFKITIALRNVNISNLDTSKEINNGEREPLSGHILIAEDNKTNQMLICILIQEMGLTYKIANDGIEAVNMFSKDSFDLVLMDENMPNLNGIGAMHRIQELYGKDVPIIALTANVMSGDKERFLSEGMDGYIAKPIDDDELYNELKYFLDMNTNIL